MGPTWTDVVWVVLGGFGAGAVNGVAGGGTLLSFPALLAAGLPPVAANITSTVGLVSGYAGGAIAYREELSGQGPRVLRLLAMSALGGVLGATILLSTPASAFEAVVPFLVLFASVLLVVQPPIARYVAARRAQAGGARADITWPVQVGVLLGAVYGAYFGAGLGVMMLAFLGIFLQDHLHRVNALRGVISLIVNLVGVSIFAFSGRTVWWAAGILFVTAYLGGHVGVALARRLPATWLRAGVGVLGVVVATALFVQD